MRALVIFIFIGNLLVFGTLGFFLFVPKKITVTTQPSGTRVTYDGNMLCPRTPCDISLNRAFSKELLLEHPRAFSHIIVLPFWGDGWDSIFENPVELRLLVDMAKRDHAMEICRAKRRNKPSLETIDAEPCYRVPPMMPRHAIRSGHCHLVFDISAVGKPQNIRLKTCTDVVFADGAKAVIAIWEYLPAMEGGRAVIRKNVETKLSFRLADERGNLIPEPDSFADDPRHAIDFIEGE